MMPHQQNLFLCDSRRTTAHTDQMGRLRRSQRLDKRYREAARAGAATLGRWIPTESVMIWTLVEPSGGALGDAAYEVEFIDDAGRIDALAPIHAARLLVLHYDPAQVAAA